MDEWLARKDALEAKLQPERMRATLAFAGLYQMTHQLIKEAVLDEVRQFYFCGFNEKGFLYDEGRYKERVLDLASKDRFRASLLWLVGQEAITSTQADRLDDIYKHRHDLTHELMKYIVDPDFEPDVELFGDALQILAAIRRYWTEIEIGIGTFEDHPDVTAGDVAPLSLHVLQMCIDAYLAGLPSTDSAASGAEATN
jgi:hypothetical protein